ncbi:HLH-domain-containing protein [Lichtheimia hyalospora FSU 10163]|nr:HLH-domain-containing protein [Lichtheimia hyalospora FSU 10163]
MTHGQKTFGYHLPWKPATPPTSPQQKPKSNTAHNIIERRYRNNINDRISELRDVVPALRHAKVGKKRKASSSDPDEQEEYIDGVAVATKLNKATILKKATDYIHHLKYTNDQLQQENLLLQQCLQRLPGGSSAITQFQTYKQQQQQHTFSTLSTTTPSSSSSTSVSTTTTTTFMALFLCMSFSLPAGQSDNHTATNTVPSETTGTGEGLSVMRLLLLILIGLFLLFPHHAHKHNKEHQKHTDTLPQRFLPWHLFLQVLRFVIRHMVGVDIHSTSPSQEPSWLDTWIHNDNDPDDASSNNKESPLTRVYACIRMINLAETLDAVDMVQVYATVALRIDPISRWMARYLWRRAMYEMTEDHPLHSLTWDVHHQADDDAMLDTMLESQAWKETLDHTQPTLQQLASLHLLDNLRTEFARLVISITSPPTTTTTHPFHPLLMAATSLSGTHPAAWLAAVGVAVEALWRSDATQAQEAIALVQKTVRTTLGHKMVHMLSGAMAMIDDGEQHQDDTETAVQRLLEAEATQQYMKRLVRRRRVQGLDSEVLALAEFVVCLAGLQAWIDVWRHHAWAASHVKDLSLTLRRMMRCSSLEKLPTHQVLVDRLSRLGYFAGHPVDDEDDVDEQQLDCHADKAIAILHGLI